MTTAEGKWQGIFQNAEKMVVHRIIWPGKLSFMSKGEIKMFANKKRNLREYLSPGGHTTKEISNYVYPKDGNLTHKGVGY